MINIYGTVGYTYLESKNSNKKILVLSDVHSKLVYCKNYINISNWFSENMDKVNILLEEVSREDFNLGELWSESDHTIKLKNLFLKNQHNITDIDIRPYLIPFSWEIDIKDNHDIYFYKYLDQLNDFIYLRHNKFFKKIKKMYKSNNIKNTSLDIHLKMIREKFKNYVRKYDQLLNEKINLIKKQNKKVLEESNDLLNDCMEWYTIVKIFDITNNKNVIIHTGLYHSEKIIKLLEKYHNFIIIDKQGINTINDAIKNSNHDGCILIPKFIEEKILKYLNN